MKCFESVSRTVVLLALVYGLFACGTTAGEVTLDDVGATDVGGSDVSSEECVLVAEPVVVDMGRFEAGAIECVDVVVANVGTASCSIVDYAVTSQTGAFFAEPFATLYPRVGVALQPAGSATGATQLTMEVCFSPQNDNHDSGAIDVLVGSVEPTSALRVPLVANDGFACIEVTPTLAFGAVRAGDEALETLTIKHCGDVNVPNPVPLVVSSIRWSDLATDEVFERVPQSLPVELLPGEAFGVSVYFRPRTPGLNSWRFLRIGSNDPAQPIVYAGVTGSAVEGSCPTAVPACMVRGISDVPSDYVVAVPTDVLDCVADASDDVDGEIVEYRWEVVSQPVGSSAAFETPTARRSQFRIDLPAYYELQLTTVDNDGCVSPSPGRVQVFAFEPDDLRVKLAWYTSGDTDDTDRAGADFDLHLLHPSGCWEESPWDASFRNINPNWGDRARSDDDPSLDVDDTSSGGPETISLDNPESELIYRVGAHLWDDHRHVPATAVVRFYVRGSLAFVASREMARTGQFWDAATIAWPSGEIVSVDTLYDDIADAVCP